MSALSYGTHLIPIILAACLVLLPLIDGGTDGGATG